MVKKGANFLKNYVGLRNLKPSLIQPVEIKDGNQRF